MRLALVFQWLRVANADPARRPAAVRFAIGVTVVQIGWVTRLHLPHRPPVWLVAGFVVLAAAELLVPAWAERHARTPWHPQHIADRYAQFTIIVLGESVAAAVGAIQTVLDTGHGDVPLLSLAGAGLVIVFSMWWLYFDQPAHELLTSLRMGFFWGYGHYFVFGSAAAVGAGLAVAIDHKEHASHLPVVALGYTIALPVAIFLLIVWVLHVLPRKPHGPITVAFPATAVLVLATPFAPAAINVIAVLLAALVAVTMINPR
jgi:low temperature requirement protein LtrA